MSGFGSFVSHEMHEMKRELHMVPPPLEIKRDEATETLTSRHSKFTPALLDSDTFAVTIHSDAPLFYNSSRHRYRGPSSWKRSHDDIICYRNDHLELIEHGKIDRRSLTSRDREVILHHADPFGYEPEKDSNNRKFFQEHYQVTHDTIPSDAILNRADLIQLARLNGRLMAKKLNAPFAESASISLAEMGASFAVNKGLNTGGGLLNIINATSAAGAAKATLISGGITAPLMAISHFVEKEMRFRRMKPVERDSGRLKRESGAIFSEAKRGRDVYLEHVDKLVKAVNSQEETNRWNTNKNDLIDAWDKVDSGLTQYLDRLSRGVAGKSDNIPKEFAKSLVTLAAYKTKLSLIAERRLLRDLQKFANEMGAKLRRKSERDIEEAEARRKKLEEQAARNPSAVRQDKLIGANR